MATITPIPTRALGKTGVNATIFGLGGEGVLRTHGRTEEAKAVIHRALEVGVTYFDCARAYAGSEEYYGASLNGKRKHIFLTSKAFERSKQGAMAQLDQTLRNMRTDYLDLWQVHDVRDPRELDMISHPSGALEAFRQAREQGKVRFIGVTGHYDPAVLSGALDTFEFDTVLMPINPTEAHYNPFMASTLLKARDKGIGVIGMKVTAQGQLLNFGVSMELLMRYALTWPISTVIIGCTTPREVEENARIAQHFEPLSEAEMREVEKAFEQVADRGQYYKKGMY